MEVDQRREAELAARVEGLQAADALGARLLDLQAAKEAVRRDAAALQAARTQRAAAQVRHSGRAAASAR